MTTYQKLPQPHITVIAGLILVVVALLVGMAVFFVMQHQAGALLSKNLQNSLQNRVALTRKEISAGFDRAKFIASRPLLIRKLQGINADTNGEASRIDLLNSVNSLLSAGFTAIALFDKDGRLVAQAGTFAKNPALRVPLYYFHEPVELIWDRQLLLHAAVDIRLSGRKIGEVITEATLPDITAAIRSASELGKTGELTLCAGSKDLVRCFPTTLYRSPLILPARLLREGALPINRSLAGETGFVAARDYRLHNVVAAYAPVDGLGLGMVLKMDGAELYAPIWRQLFYLLPLLGILLMLALLSLKWLITPLVVRLMRSEQDARDMSAGLRDSEQRIRSLFDSVDEGIATISDIGTIELFNAGAERMFGYKSKEMIGKNVSVLMPEPYRSEHDGYIAAYLRTHEAHVIGTGREVTALRSDGTQFPMELRVSEFNLGGHHQFIGIMRDITQRKKTDEALWIQANFDTLTGLPNRHMFYDRLTQEIRKSQRSGLPMALLLLDLDRFKEVNDTMGHAQGDILLVQVAHRLNECVRDTDTVARIGGDEFTVILPELKSVARVEQIAQNLVARLAQPYQLGEERAFVSASIGIAFLPEENVDAYVLLKNADQAMYVAKNEGRNRYSYFTASMQETAKTKMNLVNDLHDALLKQQFLVLYQPIVTLADGSIYKAEALIRWQHPQRGLVNPEEFISLLEETGMIIEIGTWIFRQAAAQVAFWRARYHAEFQISVNVSPVQFHYFGADFASWFSYLNEIGVPGHSMVAEITEGLLLDASNSVTSQLLAFRDAGIGVALDDFGTGYSSLSYLKKFDIDYLKIDQSFVRDLASDTNDRALCEAIIVMAHKLGLKVIAEGVETMEQRNLLLEAGCDYAQGYLFSRPLPAAEFEKMLKTGLP
ncbi:MAG TPA: EAL domain-containing protein [Burkholderiales bacterium]|nr:EAL domain-containing protein [Burkholderiales bacterium]